MSAEEAFAWSPRRQWLNMIFVDHGVFRLFYNTASPVGPSGQMFRSSQPWPHQLEKAAAQGLRTVINLRGARRCGAYALEVATCRRLGVALENCPIGSREAPKLERLEAMADLFDRIAYPALMHCKSGADRAGLAAALYLLIKENRPLSEAQRQLSLRYGHIRQAKTGMLDAFLDAYGAALKDRPRLSLMEWVRDGYDRDALIRDFSSRGWANRLVDGVLRRE